MVALSPPKVSPWNIPNLLTTLRLLLAIAVVVLIPLNFWWPAFASFTIAATTDWADGYYARKYGQVTKVGRIFDPFVDKVIICGTFIALVAIPSAGIQPWLAIVVTARELLVTSLRGLIEGSGGDFSARWLGKWKMVAQCATAMIVLFMLAAQSQSDAWLGLRTASIVITTILTVWSGLDYVLVAGKVLGLVSGSGPAESERDG